MALSEIESKEMYSRICELFDDLYKLGFRKPVKTLAYVWQAYVGCMRERQKCSSITSSISTNAIIRLMGSE